jgi:hypothetical protein
MQQALAIPLTLESGVNGNFYVVEGTPGTAGTQGVDYALGTYLAGGNGGLGHGFKNAYLWHDHFCAAVEPDCYISGPPAFSATGALSAVDHNWLQGTTLPIIVDLGAGNAADQAIVFNSIDHLGFGVVYGDPEKDFWNGFIEGIEFTVYATNDLADALACASTANAFGGVNGVSDAGVVPAVGSCSSFEQGTLDYVFIDGWSDFGQANEGDDYASVWQFSQPYRYIAVYSHFTDPVLGDGFQSEDNELDAIGRFLTQVGEPCPNCPSEVIGGELLPINYVALAVAGLSSVSLWVVPLVAGIAGAGFFALRFKR